MTPSDTVSLSISAVAELLAHNGYDVSEPLQDLLRVRDLQTGVSFQAALEGNVLYMTVHLMTIPNANLTADLLRRMLSAGNGISTSSFRLYDAADYKTAVTLNNFCKLQDMGPDDHDDILTLASYLLVDVIAARDLLQPTPAAA